MNEDDFSRLPPAARAYIRELETRNRQLGERITQLEEQFRLAQSRRFAPSSEKLKDRVFDEAEQIATGAYVDDIDAVFMQSLWVLGAIFAGISMLLVALVAVTNRSIVRTIGGDPAYAAGVADAIASGDLTVAIATRSGDTSSLLHVMQRMRDALTGTIRQIKRASDNVACGANEIANGNADLSARTENQAASLQETASNMEQMTAMVRQTADHARTASELAAGAAQIANRGGKMITEAVSAMKDISNESGRMVEIIVTIEGIAFQTNILALNAAVEASCAGEQGRGFAVVAGEVRSLAQRSATAAKEIRELISHAVERVGNGATLVESTGSTIDDARDAILRVTGVVQEIAAAAAEQSAGIDQVNLAVTQMDSMTQQNAALVEEAAAAAQSLKEQALHLQHTAAAFQVDTRGASVIRGPTPSFSRKRHAIMRI